MPAAVCLLTAAGMVAAVLGAEVTLSWQHSVEKVEWQEDWRAENGRLVLVAARVKGSGAGMEPPPGAVLAGGWWTWRPDLVPLEQVVLSRSDFVADYRICLGGACRPMDEVAPREEAGVTVMAACEEGHS